MWAPVRVARCWSLVHTTVDADGLETSRFGQLDKLFLNLNNKVLVGETMQALMLLLLLCEGEECILRREHRNPWVLPEPVSATPMTSLRRRGKARQRPGG